MERKSIKVPGRAPKIVWDFDGTLTVNGEWQGHEVIHPPRTKWLNVIRRLHEEDGVVHHISTCRLNPYLFSKDPDPNVSSGLANRCLRKWLADQKMLDVFTEITGWKAYGDMYFDDRTAGFSALDEMDEDALYIYIKDILVCSGLLD